MDWWEEGQWEAGDAKGWRCIRMNEVNGCVREPMNVWMSEWNEGELEKKESGGAVSFYPLINSNIEV